MRNATAAAIIAGIIAGFIGRDAALGLLVTFAAFGVYGAGVCTLDLADDIARVTYTKRGRVDAETARTLVLMGAAFVMGAAFAWTNGAGRALTMLTGTATMGATLVIVILALVANDAMSARYTRR